MAFHLDTGAEDFLAWLAVAEAGTDLMREDADLHGWRVLLRPVAETDLDDSLDTVHIDHTEHMMVVDIPADGAPDDPDPRETARGLLAFLAEALASPSLRLAEEREPVAV
jgi:hypothetical protein